MYKNYKRLNEAPLDSKTKSILSSKNKYKLINWFQDLPPETGFGLWFKDEGILSINKKRVKNVSGAFFYKHKSGRFKAWSIQFTDNELLINDNDYNTVLDDGMIRDSEAVVEQLLNYWALTDAVKQNGVGVFNQVRPWLQTVKKVAKNYFK